MFPVATCFDVDEKFEPITLPCTETTTLGDLYLEVSQVCKTNPFHLTISSLSGTELVNIEIPMMILLGNDDIFQFKIHDPKTFFPLPRTAMKIPPTIDTLPEPLPGPFNSLKDIPARTILDPGLYFSTLKHHSATLLPLLRPSQPDLVKHIEENDFIGFYNNLQNLRFSYDQKKLVQKLRESLQAAQAASTANNTSSTSSTSSSARLQSQQLASLRQNMQSQSQPQQPQLTEAEIKEQERLQRIEENILLAIEYAPENFANVHMLYIRAELNGVPVKVFVDSGAQMTIISQKCAERVGLMDIVDTRFTGTAVGVGTNKIIGRIHAAQLSSGSINLLVSASVLESSRVDLILGLEQMMANQMIIDLKDRCLRVGDESVPFLSEHEIPKSHFATDASPEDYEALNTKDHEETVKQHEENKQKMLLKFRADRAAKVEVEKVAKAKADSDKLKKEEEEKCRCRNGKCRKGKGAREETKKDVTETNSQEDTKDNEVTMHDESVVEKKTDSSM